MKSNLRNAGITFLALFALVLSTFFLVGTSADETAADSSGDDNDTAVADVDPVTGLPIVGNDESSTPDEPLSGTESNDDSRTPVVREGQTVASWTELDELLSEDDSYTECVTSTVPGFDWDEDIDVHVEYEAEDDSEDTRFILAVNVNLNDGEIRDKASADVEEDLSGLEILRQDSIINTRGFANGGGCEEFLDTRSQIRVSLGALVFEDDGTVKGLSRDGGVLVDCHNPWRVVPEPEPEPEPTPTPSPEPTPTPEPKCFKDGEGEPVFDSEFCAASDSGPEQQPREESDDHGTTDGYTPGDAEEVQETRNEECPSGQTSTTYGCEVSDSEQGASDRGGGEESVVSEPPESAPDNPDYDGSTPSDGTSEGTTNDADSTESGTVASDDGNGGTNGDGSNAGAAEEGDPGGF